VKCLEEVFSEARLPLLRSSTARVEFPRGEILAQLLASCLHEPGVLEYVADLGAGGIATDVLFLEHFPEVRPIPDAVDYVLEYLLLAPRMAGAEKLLPERYSSLSHFRSRLPLLLTALV
jgi:hypothetical protein